MHTESTLCCVLCSLFFFEVVGLGPVYVSTISLIMPLGISLLALILQSMTKWYALRLASRILLPHCLQRVVTFVSIANCLVCTQ
jgi:hypothetical protein